MRLSQQTKIDLLKPIPLFAGCSRKELEAVSRVADELRIPAGQVLMRQGSPGRELIVLAQGEVTVERDGATIAVRRDGDYVGELALVTGRPRTATVTAATDLRALVIDRTSFERLLRDVPAMAVKVIQAVAEASCRRYLNRNSGYSGEVRMGQRSAMSPEPRRRRRAPGEPASVA